MNKSVGLAVMISLAALAGCGRSEEEKGGLTSEESRKLDEIANRLDTTDTSPDSMTVTDETGLGNGEEPPADPLADNAVLNGQ